MRKTRILIANDASVLGTGYAVYGKELLSRLLDTGKYEIAELACYINQHNREIGNYRWKVYPNLPAEDQKKEWEAYRTNVTSAFGSSRFTTVLFHYKPDIVIDVRDYWMYSYQEVNVFRSYFKWVVMPTVDSAPQKQEWLQTFCNMDLVIPYTEWAKETLSQQCGRYINLFPEIANAGVDLDKFVVPTNKQEIKQQILGKKDARITGLVMRNQKRKLFPDVLQAYRAYLDKLLSEGKTELYENSYLYLHTSYPEANGWSLPNLLIEQNLLDKTYFTGKCSACGDVSANKFHETTLVCKKCGANSVLMPGPNNPIQDVELAKIYQCFDFFMQVAICEGFGMPQVEAAACGVPIASVDYSAMTEIVRKLKGIPIKLSRLAREMETGADRALPDVGNMIDILYSYHNLSEEERNKMSQQTREACVKYYSWDKVADVWDRAFDTLDLSTTKKWDEPLNPSDPQRAVPPNLSPREFVSFIVCDVIGSPELMKTSYIQNMIKDLVNGYTSNKNSISNYGYPDAVKNLEIFLNAKNRMLTLQKNEKQQQEIFLQDYLNVN
jgi:glycosyltransferase involved in cell wall biosynthesis